MTLILESNVTLWEKMSSRSVSLVTFTFERRNCPRLAVWRWSLQRGLTRRRALLHANARSAKLAKERSSRDEYPSRGRTRIHLTVSGTVDRVIRETIPNNSQFQCFPAALLLSGQKRSSPIFVSGACFFSPENIVGNCQKSISLLRNVEKHAFDGQGKKRGDARFSLKVTRRNIALSWSIRLCVHPFPSPTQVLKSRPAGTYSPHRRQVTAARKAGCVGASR